MGDREIPQFNRVLFAKFGNRTQELHLRRLRGDIKSVVDSSPPPVFAHLADRRKIKQRWGEEQARIEFENMQLLQRMRTIMTETQNPQFIPVGESGSNQGGSQSMLLGSSGAQRDGELNKGSLNRDARIKEMKRILHENENLLHRIQRRGPTYDVAAWEREHMIKEKQLASMGRFQYHSSTLPANVMQELLKPKPLKRFGTARYPVTESTSDDERRARSRSRSPQRKRQEEKSQSRKKKTMRKAASMGVIRSAPAPLWPPVEVEFTIENLHTHLVAPGDSPGPPPMPRALLYARNAATGEYVPLSELKLKASGKGSATVFSSSGASIPGIDSSPEALEQGADRRIRLAIFSGLDPAFSLERPNSQVGLRVPVDNVCLLGEARFSLAHFLTFQKPLYKLKVLKHGLPIAGPNFGQPSPLGVLPPTVQGLTEEQIARRRRTPEAILVLRHTNRTEPFPEPPPSPPTPEPVNEHKNVCLRFAALGPAAAAACVGFVFTSDASNGFAESAVGHTEAFAPAEDESDTALAWADAITIGQYGLDPKRALRVALYSDPDVSRKSLLGEVHLTVREILTHAADAAEAGKAESDIWTLPLRAGGKAVEGLTLLLHVDDPPRLDTSADRWSQLVLARHEELAAQAEDAALSAAEQARLQKLVDYLRSARGEALWSQSSYTPASFEDAARGLMQAAGDDDAFLARYLQLASDPHAQHYASADALIAAVGEGLHTLKSSRAAILSTLRSQECALLPQPVAAALTDAQVDELMNAAGLPFSPLAPTCAAHTDEALQRCASLSGSKLSFKTAGELATALKNEPVRLIQLQASAERAAALAAAADAKALRELQLAKAKQEVEVAAVQAKHQVKAATKIQAVQRGRVVRQHKAETHQMLAERKAKATADREAKAAAEAARLAAEAAAAKAKAEAEAAARKLAAERAAEEKRLAAERAAEEAAKRKAAEEAAARKKAAQEALSQTEMEMMPRTYSVKMLIGCKNLPVSPAGVGPSSGTCHPMVALYGKHDSAGAQGSFQFLSQSERIVNAPSPSFLEPILIDELSGPQEKQFMFSVYNVADEDSIKEEDVIGTALMTQKEIFRAITKMAAGRKTNADGAPHPFKPLNLPIVHNGVLLPGATLTVMSLTYELAPVKSEEQEAVDKATAAAKASAEAAAKWKADQEAEKAAAAAAAAAAALAAAEPPPVVIPEGSVGVYVSLKHILLPAGMQTCNALAALYYKESDSSNFLYACQSFPVLDSTSPVFTQPLVIAKPADGSDTECMLNVYNHLSDDIEVSDDAALGACLFSLRKFLDSPAGALRVPLVKDGAIRGQVILKVRPDASSNVPSRPASAVAATSSTSAAAAAPPTGFDLFLSCTALPPRPGHDTPDPMIALYAQDAATDEFGYVGQTEKAVGSASPSFAHAIRIQDVTAEEGEKPLMFMIYDVQDEANIQETDQIGTCALTWAFLKEQVKANAAAPVTLPLLDLEGEPMAKATITIKVAPAK